MRSLAEQEAIRAAVFEWLGDRQRQGQFEFTRAELEAFSYSGERIPLLDTGRGIRNPANFDATLTVMTSAKAHPYGDEIEADGRITYSLQSRDGGDNVKLLRAAKLASPMAYFKGIREGAYVPYFPVVVDEVDHDRRLVRMRELDSAIDYYPGALRFEVDGRLYGQRVVRTRQHQKAFRAKVLSAYGRQCVVCRLNKADLLDAAHIVGDAEKHGVPETWNGMSMCSLHHRAYDTDLLGIDRRSRVHVSAELLQSQPPAFVRSAFSAFMDTSIAMPLRAADRPHPDALQMKFENFLVRQQ